MQVPLFTTNDAARSEQGLEDNLDLSTVTLLSPENAEKPIEMTKLFQYFIKQNKNNEKVKHCTLRDMMPYFLYVFELNDKP